MGFTEVLTIVFIVLKLAGVISWSWWLVLLPEIIVIVLHVVIAICDACEEYEFTKYRRKRAEKNRVER